MAFENAVKAGEGLYNNGDFVNALAHFQRAKQLCWRHGNEPSPLYVQTLRMIGLCEFNRGNLTASITHIEDALTLVRSLDQAEPSVLIAYAASSTSAGEAYLSAGRPTEAIAAF